MYSSPVTVSVHNWITIIVILMHEPMNSCLCFIIEYYRKMHFVSIPRPDDEIVIAMELNLFYMVVSLQLRYM